MRRSMLGMLCLAGATAIVAAPRSAQAQNAVLRGTVRSDNGEAVVGANVYILEVGAQSPTNDRGAFVITIPGDRVRGQQFQLRARAIGYRPSSRSVTLTSGEQTIDFTMAADINRLDEIVVTGVMEGTEKAKVPFAVSSVDMADVPITPVDPLRMLAGRVPGANITSATGRPGASASVILRGPTSIDASGRSQGPLYIVDGVIINGSLPDFNPADIENVEVVKGAAASSLYGARAGNGVIQITTRSGRRSAEGMSFNLRGETGGSDIEGTFPLARQTTLLMDERGERFCINRAGAAFCENSIDWATESARVNNEPGDFALTPASMPIDLGAGASGAPLKNMFQAQLWPGRTYNAIEQSVLPQPFRQMTVDATGRYNQTQVFTSIGVLDQSGSIRYLNGFNRYSARLNVDQRLSDRWNVAMRTFYSRSRADGFDQENGTAFFRLTRVPAAANLLARDTLGRLYVRTNLGGGGFQNENPLVSLQGQKDVGVTDRFISGMTLRFAPAAWLDLEGNGSFDLTNYQQDFFRDKGLHNTGLSAALPGGFIRQYADREQSYNASFNATARQHVGRNILARWNARFLYERQDALDKQGSGGPLGAVDVNDLDNATAGFAVSSSSSSIRQVGLFGGLSLDILDGRYILEGLLRRDGTSLFGSENRWATFGRMSMAWRASNEPWWFGGRAFNDLKFRYSRGSAGGRPRFSGQYQTFTITTAGPVLGTQGNPALRPEITVDNEFGADMELFHRVGVQVTRALGETRNQILLVPLAAEKGFGQQWRNAGTIENKTWELAVNLPVITHRNVNWSWRFTYDQTRTVVTELAVPPFNFGDRGMFLAKAGERYGTFYGRTFVRSCAQLPATFQADCGVDGQSSYQFNDEGYLVWVGAGSAAKRNSWREGVTRNLWQTSIAGCVPPVGQAACASTLTPWGVPLNWGMPIILRDDACIAVPNPSCGPKTTALGNGLPDYQFSVSSNLQFGRFTVYGLLQGVMGREVWNEGRHWSHLDFVTSATDQRGKSVELAKPVGYYWRTTPVDGFTGVGGFYDILSANSHFVESTSYAKLRELMLSYNVGPVGGVGNWTASVVGRNLFTITDYRGFDPEVGQTGGTANSGAINAVDAFVFPNTRSLTFSLSTSF